MKESKKYGKNFNFPSFVLVGRIAYTLEDYREMLRLEFHDSCTRRAYVIV